MAGSAAWAALGAHTPRTGMVPGSVRQHGVRALHAWRTIGWDGVKARSQVLTVMPPDRRDKDVSPRAYISHRHHRPHFPARSSRSFSSTTTIPTPSHIISTMSEPVYVSPAAAYLSFRSDRHELQRRHWPHRFGRHGMSSPNPSMALPSLCTHLGPKPDPQHERQGLHCRRIQPYDEQGRRLPR